MASLTSIAFTGPALKSKAPSTTLQTKRFTTVAMKVKKGINKAVKYGSPNTGTSKALKDKNFVDPSGRKGTGKGVYQFESKYGANVDGYSPIYSPGEWKSDGNVYEGGLVGLAIWAVGLLSLLGVGAYAIYSTSAL